MESLDPKELTVPQLSKLILGAVVPRPIALVSSLSKNGVPNLAPFSFFNVFGYSPPVLGFSPANRGRDGTLKDTYINIKETKECVVHIVTHSMGEQVSLASREFNSDINEFEKSGFTPISSDLVKANRVKESPFQMECKLRDIINLGDGPASGNLILCDIIRIHIKKDLNWQEGIDPLDLDAIGRLGGSDYTKLNKDSIYQIEKPTGVDIIGFDNIPKSILHSKILSGSELAVLASYSDMPSEKEVMEFKADVTNSFNKRAEDPVPNLENEQIKGENNVQDNNPDNDPDGDPDSDPDSDPDNEQNNHPRKVSVKGAFETYCNQGDYRAGLNSLIIQKNYSEEKLHKVAKMAIEDSSVVFAWKTLMLHQ